MESNCYICGGLMDNANGKKYCSSKCLKIKDRKRNKEYRENKLNKNIILNGRKRYEKANKIKVAIRHTTRRHEKKENICLFCGEKGTTQFNHMSYNPNVFFEVCRDCHEELHHNKNLKVRFIREVKEKTQ